MFAFDRSSQDARGGATLEDQAFAERLAAAAGAALCDLRARSEPGDPRALGEAGDRLSHEFLVAQLVAHRPGDAVLSEEGADDPRRLTADRVWIIDPLDGTREFSEAGAEGAWRDDWAVHVALWVRGQGVPVGAVAIPARHQVFGTRGAVASARGAVLPAGGAGAGAAADRIRLAVSRSHPAPVVARLRELLDVELLPMGSAGVKTMAVVSGQADAYVHDGGQFEWDSAAPVAVARAAGLVAHRLDGSPLEYNRPDPWLPDLLVCTPRVAPALEQALQRYRS